MPEQDASAGTGTTEESSNTEETKAPSIEEVAAQQGWNAEYDGVDKIDAAEYVRRKPLFDKIKAQSRELKDVKKLVEGMASTYKSMSDAQYKKGIAEAEGRMKSAEASFDVAGFKAAAGEKAQLETAMEQNKAPTAEPQEVTEFCERNKWFESDAIMRTDALEYRDKFIKRNPNASLKETLQYVEAKIKRDYPESFEDEHKSGPTKRTATVEGASTQHATDPMSKLKASMTGEEKRIMRMYVKDGGMTEAEYLKSYSEVRDK